MGKETVRAIIDDREPEELILAFAEHEDVIDWRVERLEVGDIQFANTDVVLERKTPGDYNSSLTSNHLPGQVKAMNDTTDNCAVLVEGTLPEVYSHEHSSLSGASVRGSMASFYIREGVPVIPCGTQKNLVDLAIRMARKSLEEPGRKGIDTGPVDRSEPTLKRMIACVEGIGPDTAETVHSRYETVSELSSATVEELTELEGIGNTTANKILKAFK